MHCWVRVRGRLPGVTSWDFGATEEGGFWSICFRGCLGVAEVLPVSDLSGCWGWNYWTVLGASSRVFLVLEGRPLLLFCGCLLFAW